VFRRTVASITASLAKMVKDLEAHAVAKVAEYERHITESKRFVELADEARAEVDKAKAAAEKIAGLLA